MNEYEIVYTYLNGCAGEAYPQTSFEEAEIESPESYLKAKFGKDYAGFVKTVGDKGQLIYTFDNGVIKHIYEFVEL